MPGGRPALGLECKLDAKWDKDTIKTRTTSNPSGFGRWLFSEQHLRFELLWLSAHDPEGNQLREPLERCTISAPIITHASASAIWTYQLSRRYDEPNVMAEGERLVTPQQPRVAACVYESRVARFSRVEGLDTAKLQKGKVPGVPGGVEEN